MLLYNVFIVYITRHYMLSAYKYNKNTYIHKQCNLLLSMPFQVFMSDLKNLCVSE